jgi:transposase
MITQELYTSDISDAEWAFVGPYLCLLPEKVGQRVHNLGDVFVDLRWIVLTAAPLRYLPTDFPPWEMVYQESRRWLAAGRFQAIVHDLRAVLRLAAGKKPEPSAAIFDGRTMQSTPENCRRAGCEATSDASARRSTWPSTRLVVSWPCATPRKRTRV